MNAIKKMQKQIKVGKIKFVLKKVVVFITLNIASLYFDPLTNTLITFSHSLEELDFC